MVPGSAPSSLVAGRVVSSSRRRRRSAASSFPPSFSVVVVPGGARFVCLLLPLLSSLLPPPFPGAPGVGVSSRLLLPLLLRIRPPPFYPCRLRSVSRGLSSDCFQSAESQTLGVSWCQIMRPVCLTSRSTLAAFGAFSLGVPRRPHIGSVFSRPVASTSCFIDVFGLLVKLALADVASPHVLSALGMAITLRSDTLWQARRCSVAGPGLPCRFGWWLSSSVT